MQSRLVFRRNREIFDHFSKRYYLSVKGQSEWPFIWCLPIRQKILNVSADNSNIPWNPPTIRYPDGTAIAPQMSLLSLCALLFRQSHLFLICVVLTYNVSRIILHKTCQIPRNCQCKWLLVSSSAPGTSLSSCWSPVKFLFYTGRIVTTELQNLVPQRRIGDCCVIHFLH